MDLYVCEHVWVCMGVSKPEGPTIHPLHTPGSQMEGSFHSQPSVIHTPKLSPGSLTSSLPPARFWTPHTSTLSSALGPLHF